MDIYNRTLSSLEWDKVKYYLSGHCQTEAGKSESLTVELHDHLTIVQALLAETEEAYSLLVDKTLPSLANFPDISTTLARLEAAAPLNVKELWQIRSVLTTARSVQSAMSLLREEDFIYLTKWIKQLRLVDPVRNAIEAAIDAHGNVRDEASTELMALRIAHAQVKAAVKEELTKIINSSELSKCLQEPLFTQRNGRYVLPVIASMRGSFPGIIHDSSASGLTVYIEPSSIIALANNLRLKELEIEHEIERLLCKLSEIAKDHYREIVQTYRVIIELDKIFARARLGHSYKGVVPTLTDEEGLLLYDAKHPLMILQNSSREVVGNDLVFGAFANSDHGQGQTLIITGPNTGGKTVLLKTLGLLSLMVKAGLMLPVKSGSQARIFKEIYADIGDEQSLEQSLSTFSAHLLNIKQIVVEAGRTSLVLLDEIGSGTDPKEGAALAQAILEHLHHLGALTVATTHLAELKAMGYAQNDFINASFAFDAVNLVPTYKLRIGIPGSSQATTIAQCLGLDKAILDRTNELLSNAKDQMQQSVDAIEKRLGELRRSQEETDVNRARADELKRLYETKLEQLTNERETLQKDYAKRLNNELNQSKKLIRELTADLQKQPSLAKVQAAQLQWQSIKENAIGNAPVAKAADLANLHTLAKGQLVYITSIGQTAVIEAVPKDFQQQSNPIIQLRAGNVRIKVPLSDLRSARKTLVDKRKNQPGRQFLGSSQAVANGSFKADASQSAVNLGVFVRTEANTLDLRGQRVEHALILLASFLDRGVHNGTGTLMIIHGHGTGALKSAVRQELSTNKIDFRPGQNFEGGDGVTVITLA